MPEPLKNLYTPAFIGKLASALHTEWSQFHREHFTALVFDSAWEERELKARMRHITQCLRAVLPPNYREALAILRPASRHFSGFLPMFFPDFVELYGQDDVEASIPALEHFTQFSSSEFAVRPFIVRDPDTMMAQMLAWAHHGNHHVRRLASEGCRPRLPWAMALPALKKDPSPIFPVLETLKADSSEYVRRSVANNLNDIAKDHPALVLDTARRWLGRNPDTNWVVRHACRTLLKRGNEEALSLFGFANDIPVTVEQLVVQPASIALGDVVEFAFSLRVHAKQPINVRVEYGVDFVKANGSTSQKIFRISERVCKPDEVVQFQKRHSFRDLSTRKHYPGTHGITIVLNGKPMTTQRFDVGVAQ